MLLGSFNPEISVGFTGTPEVVYSPIVPLPFAFATNRSEPDSAMPDGLSNPVISAAFTSVPEVVYSPIVPMVALATNRSAPDTAMPVGTFSPEISAAFNVVPAVVYAPIVLSPMFVSKIVPARAALEERDPCRAANRPNAMTLG